MYSQIYLEDCLELFPKILDKSIDLILCDLPYGTTSCKWDIIIPFSELWAQYERVIKDKGAIVLFGSQPFTSALVMSRPDLFKYEWIWFKNTQTGISLSKYQPMRSHENILVFCRERHTFNKQPTKSRIENIETREGKIRHRKGKSEHSPSMAFNDGTFNSNVNPRTVLEFNAVNNANGKLHPTQKPVALLEYLIKTYTNEGDLVLDNAMGSGSTGVACANLNRNFIGIEKDEKYFEIAKKRIFDAENPLG